MIDSSKSNGNNGSSNINLRSSGNGWSSSRDISLPLSIYLSVYLSIYLFLSLSLSLSIYLSLSLSLSHTQTHTLSIYLSFFLSIQLTHFLSLSYFPPLQAIMPIVLSQFYMYLDCRSTNSCRPVQYRTLPKP
jgi:hypothetical protein